MELIESFRVVSHLLRMEQKLGISRALTSFLTRGGLLGSAYAIRQNALSALRPLFPRSTPAELDLFVFYFLIRLTSFAGKQMGLAGSKSIDATVMRDSFSQPKHSMSELNEADLLYLQSMMDRKSALETMISNAIYAAMAAQSALAGNLKAS